MNYANTDWDYDSLETGIQALRREAYTCREKAKQDFNTPHYWIAGADALEQAAAFIDYNREQAEILSPLQNYIINK